jgi:hypothetical protein
VVLWEASEAEVDDNWEEFTSDPADSAIGVISPLGEEVENLGPVPERARLVLPEGATLAGASLEGVGRSVPTTTAVAPLRLLWKASKMLRVH